MAGGGKHAGARKGPRKRARLDGRSALLAAGVTFCVVSWGYLVTAAVDFGRAARDGRSGAWFFLLLACLGAAACLFAGLLLGVRTLRALGVMSNPERAEPADRAPARVPGGRHGAR